MINIQIREEDGAIVARAARSVEWSEALQNIDQELFPCLAGLLPYADAMFNSRQARRLRREVASRAVRDILGDDVAAEIDGLCKLVENGIHLYLWFLGD